MTALPTFKPLIINIVTYVRTNVAIRSIFSGWYSRLLLRFVSVLTRYHNVNDDTISNKLKMSICKSRGFRTWLPLSLEINRQRGTEHIHKMSSQHSHNSVGPTECFLNCICKCFISSAYRTSNIRAIQLNFQSKVKILALISCNNQSMP